MTREEAITLLISIHALLAESDVAPSSWLRGIKIFQSTLSLRRATTAPVNGAEGPRISIHALLAESDGSREGIAMDLEISIHALLAESDSKYHQIGPIVSV